MGVQRLWYERVFSTLLRVVQGLCYERGFRVYGISSYINCIHLQFILKRNIDSCPLLASACLLYSTLITSRMRGTITLLLREESKFRFLHINIQ